MNHLDTFNKNSVDKNGGCESIDPAINLIVQDIRSHVDYLMRNGEDEEGDISTLSLDTITGEGRFLYLENLSINYPSPIVEGVGELFLEYNNAFQDLVEANKEWDTDYQYCILNGKYVNYFVQTDMVGLPQKFLDDVQNGLYKKEEIKEFLRSRIFEFENSLAQYEFLREVFPGEENKFKETMNQSLDLIRQRFNKPIAILSTTEEKHKAVLGSELGITNESNVDFTEVKNRTGFDAIFGPDEFKQLLEENNGESPYLLCVRSSAPLSKLKNPKAQIQEPLLGDDNIRRVVKANSITMNIDNPNSANFSEKINDTKEWMPKVAMAFAVSSENDIYSQDVLEFIQQGKLLSDYSGDCFNPSFSSYLLENYIDPLDIEFHLKPMKTSYGCYGHLKGKLLDPKFRKKIKQSLKERGQYILQPQMPTQRVLLNGVEYLAIHRNFYTVDENGNYVPMQGFVNMLPITSLEAQKGTIHGNGQTIWKKIQLFFRI